MEYESRSFGPLPRRGAEGGGTGKGPDFYMTYIFFESMKEFSGILKKNIDLDKKNAEVEKTQNNWFKIIL